MGLGFAHVIVLRFDERDERIHDVTSQQVLAIKLFRRGIQVLEPFDFARSLLLTFLAQSFRFAQSLEEVSGFERAYYFLSSVTIKRHYKTVLYCIVE